MHLGDRRGGQRHRIERREGGPDRHAELALDDRLRLCAVERQHAVLQQGEIVDDVRRHEVAAGGQDLAELDEDRPEFLQRQAQARTA